MRILRMMQTIDARYLYALLMLSVALPFFIPFQLPVVVTPETEALYDAVENLPANSFVLVGIDWNAGSRGENRPQTTVILRHLMARHLRFALLDFSDPQGATLGEEIAHELQGQYGYQEGRDWVNFGYQVDMVNWLKSFVLNVPGQVQTDSSGKPVASLPVMQGIRTARNIPLVIDITPTGSYQTYIQFMAGPYRNSMKMGVALTAVMAPDAYNYLDSHQIVGLLAGLTGAAEYQSRFAQEYDKGLLLRSRVTRYSNSSSSAHILIICLILMGNIAMILERRQRARLHAKG